MKVLFVGEGPHDIGREPRSPDEPGLAGGVVPALARRVAPAISGDSVALRWAELSRFHPDAKKGFEGKVAAAALLSHRRYGLAGTVCVADRDRDPERGAAMQRGRERGLAALSGVHPIVCGLAVESIEAWTLGACAALAEELGVDAQRVRAELPGPVESLYANSGKPELRSKDLLGRLAESVHRSDGTLLRVAVATCTDLGELERACPLGFAPFANDLRGAFPRSPM